MGGMSCQLLANDAFQLRTLRMPTKQSEDMNRDSDATLGYGSAVPSHEDRTNLSRPSYKSDMIRPCGLRFAAWTYYDKVCIHGDVCYIIVNWHYIQDKRINTLRWSEASSGCMSARSNKKTNRATWGKFRESRGHPCSIGDCECVLAVPQQRRNVLVLRGCWAVSTSQTIYI